MIVVKPREYSIKAKAYKKNEFEKTKDYLKLNFKYPKYSSSFRWALHARCRYKFDDRIIKTTNMIEDGYSERCSCCYWKNSYPRLEHYWFSKYYLFYEFLMKYFVKIDILYEKFSIISKILNSNVSTCNWYK